MVIAAVAGGLDSTWGANLISSSGCYCLGGINRGLTAPSGYLAAPTPSDPWPGMTLPVPRETFCRRLTAIDDVETIASFSSDKSMDGEPLLPGCEMEYKK